MRTAPFRLKRCQLASGVLESLQLAKKVSEKWITDNTRSVALYKPPISKMDKNMSMTHAIDCVASGSSTITQTQVLNMMTWEVCSFDQLRNSPRFHLNWKKDCYFAKSIMSGLCNNLQHYSAQKRDATLEPLLKDIQTCIDVTSLLKQQEQELCSETMINMGKPRISKTDYSLVAANCGFNVVEQARKIDKPIMKRPEGISSTKAAKKIKTASVQGCKGHRKGVKMALPSSTDVAGKVVRKRGRPKKEVMRAVWTYQLHSRTSNENAKA